MAEVLPTELIEHIFSYAVHIDTPTCLAICLTNKMGQKVASNALYETIGILAPRDEDPTPTMDSRLERLSLLCRTMLESSSLAARVTGIRQYCDLLDDVNIIAPSVPDQRLLQQLIDKLPLRTPIRKKVRRLIRMLEINDLIIPDEVMQDIEEVDDEVADFVEELQENLAGDARAGLGDEADDGSDSEYEMDPVCGHHIFLAIIVLACPHIRRIEIQGDVQTFYGPFYILQALARNSKGDDPGTPAMHVDELVLSDDEQIDGIVNHVRHFATLSGLKKLKIVFMNDESAWDELDDIEDVDVEELTFESCLASPEIVSTVVDICQKLKRLKIIGARTHRRLDCNEIFTSIIENTPLLEEVHIEYPPYSPPLEEHSDHDDDLEPEGVPLHNLQDGVKSLDVDLRDQEHLHTMTLTDRILFGWRPQDGMGTGALDSLLPASMKHLSIVTDSDEIRPSDREILTQPGAEHFETLTIFNRSKTQSISKADLDVQLSNESLRSGKGSSSEADQEVQHSKKRGHSEDYEEQSAVKRIRGDQGSSDS